jgi:sigma-B regulation protein RsbU (phosphoserine phosphatase)
MYLRRKAEGRWQTVDLPEHDGPANLPLGVLADAPDDRQQTPLVSGDRMFLYTDGLVEAPDSRDEQFGMERLGAVLREAAGEDLKALKDAVLEALRHHTGGRLDHDDVTFMAVEVL